MKNAFFKYLVKFDDIYFISKLIKEQNKNYELYYNKKTKKYVVIDKEKRHACITFDYYPDARVLTKLEQTKAENAQKLFRQIELHNQKIEEQKSLRMQDLSSAQLCEVINFASKTTYDLSSEKIKKIINTEVDYD